MGVTHVLPLHTFNIDSEVVTGLYCMLAIQMKEINEEVNK